MVSIRTMAAMREQFNAKLNELIKKKSKNSFLLTKEKYEKLIKLVTASKNKSFGKKPEEYHRLKRYDVLIVDGSERLIHPLKKNNDKILYFVQVEEVFDIIHETHLLNGHGGRNRMVKELQKKYKNITAELIKIYLKLCQICQKKLKASKKGLAKSMDFKEKNSRCQVDLIDMQSQPDSDFKFIFVYQDHVTKFIQLRPLKSKSAEEVADNLIDIFTVFGAPSVLQSDIEFSNRIVEACSMWQNLKVIPRHNQSQGPLEHINQDIENMLSSWLESNQTTKWSRGLCFVQLMKNTSFHEDIKCTPYEAMFGTHVKVGLKESLFPKYSIKHFKTEEELETLTESVNNPAKCSIIKVEPDMTTDSDTYKCDWQNDNLPEVEIEIKKEEEVVIPLIESDISIKQE